MKKKVLSLIIIFIMIMSLVPVVQIKDTHASVGASINKKSVTLFVNQQYQLKLSGTKLTKVASSNKKIVAVNNKGLIKGVKVGKAIISLKGSNGKIYKCNVTVKNPYISKTSLSIIKGKNYGLKLYGTKIKSVSTSNEKIATINNNGVVKGVEKGYCYVYIKGTNNKVYKCKIEIKETYINKPFMTIAKGKTEKITLYNAKVKSVSTENAKIATISKTGVVKGISEGKTIVYIKDTCNVIHKCEVTIKNTKGIYLNKTSITLKVGQSYQLKLLGTDKKPIWESREYPVILTQDGLATGHFPGIIYVYAILDDVKYACKVKVLSPLDYNSTCKHNWKLIAHNKARCNSEEDFRYKCNKCGKYKLEFSSMLEHSYKKTYGKEPTCEENGYDRYECRDCGIILKKNYKDKVDHKWILQEKTDWAEIYYCKYICGKTKYIYTDGSVYIN